MIRSFKSITAVIVCCGLILFPCLGMGTADAAESESGIPSGIMDQSEFRIPKVVILPFDVHSPTKDSYLQNEIPKVISNHLQEEGAKIVPPDKQWAERRPGTTDAIRKAGVQSGSDYVIWGSLTQIGQKFSLDAKMTDVLGKTAPVAFFVEGESIVNLSSTVKQLAKNFGMRLFKRERVSQVVVTGNRRIESDAIKRVIKTAPGDVYLVKSLSEDLKAVYALGYFDDIRIESENRPEGKIITFAVKEKPTIRDIKVKNNKVFDDKEILEAVDIKTGQTLNNSKIQENIKRIDSLYREKNYHNVVIEYHIADLDNNQADLEFDIQEGDKIRIKSITFTGNSAYSEKKLKDVMKSSEKGFWSWVTSSGDMNKEELDQDVARLNAFYQNNGYADARIGEPQIEYRDKWIYITIAIDEGVQFKVGKVSVEGDLVRPAEELTKSLKIGREEFINRDVIRNDVLILADIYSDDGYAYSDISPRVDKNPSKQTADITYSINKDKRVYIEEIIISGNTKTRDKVIRRELQVNEQELYSGQKLKRSIKNLHRLDYFEDVKINPVKGSADDKMVLKVDITEKPTGMFSFGGGYSSVENVFVMASVSQRNLFGRGQILQLKGEIGGASNRYTLSFTEPWLMDTRMSAGFDVYNWEHDYDTYDKDSKGGGVRFGYPVFDYTRAYLSYSYDIGEIKNIDMDYAAQSVIDMEGENITSSISSSLNYDSRDKMFNPTEGANHSLTFEYAGIGGDIGFTKYLLELGQYIPLFWGTVGFLHAKGGYVEENPGMKLPDYERFYMGGMNSLRGFRWRDICLQEERTDTEGNKIMVDAGGNKFVQFNAEYLIPLIKKAGVVGVLFYDTGNVYSRSDKIELGELRQSAGFGFRWYSPMGPIRIENGYILDRKEDEGSGGRWEFTMGTAF